MFTKKFAFFTFLLFSSNFVFSAEMSPQQEGRITVFIKINRQNGKSIMRSLINNEPSLCITAYFQRNYPHVNLKSWILPWYELSLFFDHSQPGSNKQIFLTAGTDVTEQFTSKFEWPKTLVDGIKVTYILDESFNDLEKIHEDFLRAENSRCVVM